MSKYIGSSAVNLSTTSADVTGNADIDGNLTVGGNLTVSGTTITVDHATAQTVDLGDNDKIRLGDDNDLQIYHDESNSYIDEAGTGSLWIRGNDVILGKYTGEYYLYANADGALNLYYDHSKKLATTSTGVDVTGTANVDVLTQTNGAGTLTLKDLGGTSSEIESSGTLHIDFQGSNFQVNRNGTAHLNINSGGDISFYDSQGSSQSFYWDASAESLGIGGAPLSGLHISDGANAGAPQNASRKAQLMIDAGQTASADLQFMVRNGYDSHIFFGDASDPNVGIIHYSHSANHMNFTVNTTSALTIDDQGDVGIGNTDPTSRLVIEKTSARTNDAENMVRIVHNTSGTSAVGFGSKILFAGERSNGTLQNMGRIGFVSDVNTSTNLSSALILEPASNGSPFEGMRISSSGNVGIGEQDPDSTLQLSNSSSVPSFTLGRTPYSSHGNLTIGGTGTGHITSNIDEAGDSTVNVRASRVAVGNGEIDFQNSPQTAAGSARTFTTRLKVDEYGGLTIASVNATAAVFGGTNVVNGITALPSPAGTPFVLGRDTGTTRSAHFGGHLKFDSGYGIDFSATGNSSGTTTSELLDDYEEGTFSPTLTGSATAGTTTYSSRAGYYTKIGRLVNINCIVSWSSMTGSGFMELKGIPYPIANLSPGSQNYPVGAALPSNINWTGGTMLVGLGLGGSSTIALYGSSDNGGATRQNCVNESANFRLTMSYMTT